jgi:murein DD-endopeptidase MepM/ murein hydrolase activator NlpD
LLQNMRWKAEEAATELRRLAIATGRMLSSPDARWTLVSSSLTASVAFTVTWLALAAQPASVAQAGNTTQAKETSILQHIMRFAGVRSGGTRQIRQAGLVMAPIQAGPVQRVIAQEAKPQIETRTLRVGNGDTIIGMLEDAGVNARDANAIVDAMKRYYSPRNLRSGQTFEATFGQPKSDAVRATPVSYTADADDDDSLAARNRRLLSLSFSPSIERQITVNLTAPDGYMAHDLQKKLEGRFQHAGGQIDSSLYLAAVQAGIPANIVVEMIRIFSYDVDFQRDVHPGDSFEVFYNHLFTEEGQPARPGEVLTASMTLSGKTHMLYRYEGRDGEIEYFDAGGRSAKSMLMKTPVDGARISSTFGAREHPILGYTRMHKGIDFAVPKGTPVMAAGNGTVTFAGVQNGFGNIIVISHGNGYQTAYAHLSKFMAREGSRVRQGQVVAYSGMTGLATGPHLHYEIRVNNAQVNPATVKVASGRSLEGSEMKTFIAERSRIDTLVASTPVQHRLALVEGLRDTAE